jgi:hypothetical protein
MYVGSDALALAPMTDRITYLEDGDWALIRRAGAEIFDAGRAARQPRDPAHPDRSGERPKRGPGATIWPRRSTNSPPSQARRSCAPIWQPARTGPALPDGIDFAATSTG